MLLKGKETHTSEGDEYVTTTSLYCSAENPQDAFFVANDAVSAKHNLRFFFRNNKVSDISYIYKSDYGASTAASRDLADMRAKYNIYMTKTPINQEALTPVFVVIENSANINLFLSESTFVVEMAPLVFLNQTNYENIDNLSVDGVKSMYEGLGFSCNINQ